MPQSPSRNARKRRTKIVATLGPASLEGDVLLDMVRAGVDVVRLNFSHGNRDEHRAYVKRIRDAAAKTGRAVGILADLGGPKLRTGVIDGGITIQRGDEVRLVPGDTAPGDGSIPVRYEHLVDDITAGERILLADGAMELEVTGVSGDAVIALVITGGTVTSNKGVNLPATMLRIPAFTEKDEADLAAALAAGVDYIALSFVRRAEDLAPVRRMLDEHVTAAGAPLLIAKIEKPQAVDNLSAILEKTDGVMVARGDLGVECPLEDVPMIQKRIISAAREAGKVVITATQMLVSMVDSPRPTRAEAADVANAVLDGTDALMLSEETAMGKHPVEAVRTLVNIASGTEPYIDHGRNLNMRLGGSDMGLTTPAVSRAACWIASDVNATAIVTFTRSGATARMVSRHRPEAPVLGLTSEPATLNRLTLYYGVTPRLVNNYVGSDDMFTTAKREVLQAGFAESGDRVVITAGAPSLTPGKTNLIKVVHLDD